LNGIEAGPFQPGRGRGPGKKTAPESLGAGFKSQRRSHERRRKVRGVYSDASRNARTFEEKKPRRIFGAA